MSLIFAGEKQSQSCLGSEAVLFMFVYSLVYVYGPTSLASCCSRKKKRKSFFTFILRLLNVVAQIMLVTYRLVL